MRSRTRAGLWCAVLVLAGTRPASGQLWRNGSFDGFGGVASAFIGDTFEARVYDNFIVSGSGWHITSLYGEFLTDFVPGFAFWEIRSGITEGFGGSVLYSATSSVTDFVDMGDAFGYDQLGLTIGGFAPFVLGPGDYWLTIAVVGSTGNAFLGTTDGHDGVKAVTDFRFFLDSPANGYIFSDDGVPFRSDFAYGLDGQEISVVPEPSTLLLVGTGVGFVALFRLKRRRQTG